MIHPQVINPSSLGSRSNGCKQVAKMEIEYRDNTRLLFTEEVGKMDIEYGASTRLLLSDKRRIFKKNSLTYKPQICFVFL